MILTNTSKCENIEKHPSECNLNLLPNVTAKTLEKASFMSSKQLATFWNRGQKKHNSSNLTVKWHKVLSNKLVGMSQELSLLLFFVLQCPLQVQKLLCFYTAFSLALWSTLSERHMTSKTLANGKTSLESQNKFTKEKTEGRGKRTWYLYCILDGEDSVRKTEKNAEVSENLCPGLYTAGLKKFKLRMNMMILSCNLNLKPLVSVLYELHVVIIFLKWTEEKM